jgi:hypothetical protein
MLILEECRKRVVRMLSRERDEHDAILTWCRSLTWREPSRDNAETVVSPYARARAWLI